MVTKKLIYYVSGLRISFTSTLTGQCYEIISKSYTVYQINTKTIQKLIFYKGFIRILQNAIARKHLPYALTEDPRRKR